MADPIRITNEIARRTGIVTTAGTLLAAFDSRVGLIIQNLDSSPVYVKFGPTASATDFDLILKGGTATDDGEGGTLSYDVLSYTGIISVIGKTGGGSCRVTATEW